jgi:transcriptional regulator with GAF, ATPase, and Fis domain
MVAQKEFRSDLYYRLNVFPVELPPLRERRKDIPELISHFVRDFARRMGRPMPYIPTETMAALTSYSWPGNVRELQNLIERAVIRSDDGVLLNPLPRLDHPTQVSSPKPTTLNSRSGTFTECMRSLILQTLEGTAWMIGGPDGAAAQLGLPRTTLITKMKKLGISRPRRVRNNGAEECESKLQGGCDV